jgi:hypothetical protein
MMKEIQDELKSIASASEVPKEAGQSLSSRAAPPAAKPAPIIGAPRAFNSPAILQHLAEELICMRCLFPAVMP